MRHSKPIVLVVEDEPLMKMHAVSLVADAGFDTVEASNADEAIAILEARKDIRIVFADIKCLGPWTAYGSLTRYEDAGRRSNLF